MIGGLIAGPTGSGTTTVVVRAIGPSLGNFGIAGALQDPTLDLVNSSGATIRSSDDWNAADRDRSVQPRAGRRPRIDARRNAHARQLHRSRSREK